MWKEIRRWKFGEELTDLALSSARACACAEAALVELEEDWLVEAHNRARDLDEGIIQTIPAEEVRKKAQTLLT